MDLKGHEIDGYLEYAVAQWFNQMDTEGDHLLIFSDPSKGMLQHPYYNFSSAAGINYVIDLKGSNGNRVEIKGFTDGRTWDPEAIYSVAINSYRGSGGGGHLTRGAGIRPEVLKDRIRWTSEMDLRFLMMKELMKTDTLHTFVSNNWTCIPEQFYRTGMKRDQLIIMH
jgi:2',3'-cyclic-nucleotide 2'-phosphodiesterase/3'-nucleotidase